MTMSNGLAGKLAWTEADPDEDLLASATAELASEDGRAADRDQWPAALWATLERIDAPRWTIRDVFAGGAGCPRPLLVQRNAQLAGGSLTAAFILSQHDAALRRFLAAADFEASERWMSRVLERQAVATV